MPIIVILLLFLFFWAVGEPTHLPTIELKYDQGMTCTFNGVRVPIADVNERVYKQDEPTYDVVMPSGVEAEAYQIELTNCTWE